MVASVLKYLGVWFGVLLLGLLVIYAVTGSPSMLNASVKAQYEADCSTPKSGSGAGGGGLFGDKGSDSDCYDAAERALALEADQAQSNILGWYVMASIIPLFLGVAFAVQVALAENRASTPSAFMALKPRWWLYFGLITGVCVIFILLPHFTQQFGGWGAKLGAGRGWGIPLALILLSWGAYWGGTKWGTPEKMQPSLPL